MTPPVPKNTPWTMSEKMAPLGIGFLISVLKKEGHKVYFIDHVLETSFHKNILKDKKIDFVGLYLNTMCFFEGRNLLFEIEKIRKAKEWNGKIMVGGPHPSVRPEDIPDFVDHIVRGEGEKAILEIVNGSSEKIIQKEFVKDLDALPPPAWDYFARLPYDFACDFFPDRPAFNHNTSRGCPFNCTFCSNASVWGKMNRTFSAERIVEDIQHLMSNYGARGIYFREDNFACSKNRVYNFCELLLKKNINLSWACETRVDNLDNDILALMHHAGCKGIFFGVESGSQRMLDFFSKGTTLGQIKNVFDECNRLEIKTYASFVVGLTDETEQELLDTIKFSNQIKPTNKGFNIFIGIPYSKLYEYLKENDLYDFIDEAGQLFIQNHNFLVDQLMGGLKKAKIPLKESITVDKNHLFDKNSLFKEEKKFVSQFFFNLAGKLVLHGHKKESRRVCLSSLHYYVFNIRIYLLYLITFLPASLFNLARKIQLKYLPHI
jgi:radical SAM superfamily enzyme YgiQ (UPF0313 family)